MLSQEDPRQSNTGYNWEGGGRGGAGWQLERQGKFAEFCALQDWRPGVHRTDGGKNRKAVKDEADEDARTPFDANAETPAMPSDGSFQGGGKPYS